MAQPPGQKYNVIEQFAKIDLAWKVHAQEQEQIAKINASIDKVVANFLAANGIPNPEHLRLLEEVIDAANALLPIARAQPFPEAVDRKNVDALFARVIPYANVYESFRKKDSEISSLTAELQKASEELSRLRPQFESIKAELATQKAESGTRLRQQEEELRKLKLESAELAAENQRLKLQIRHEAPSQAGSFYAGSSRVSDTGDLDASISQINFEDDE